MKEKLLPPISLSFLLEISKPFFKDHGILWLGSNFLQHSKPFGRWQHGITLRMNQIVLTCQCFRCFRLLQDLFATNNHIHELSTVPTQLPALEVLDLTNNEITEWEEFVSCLLLLTYFINHIEILKFVNGRGVDNIVRKCWLPAFSFFLIMFHKSFISWVIV